MFSYFVYPGGEYCTRLRHSFSRLGSNVMNEFSFML